MASDDVELGVVQPDRRLNWAETLSPKDIRSMSTSSYYTARSNRSTSRTLTLESSRYGYSNDLTMEETQAQQSLIDLIVGDQYTQKGSLALCCRWYERYLQAKIKTHWPKLACALVGLEDNSAGPRSGDLVIVYEYVIAVAKSLQSRKDVALVEIVDELDHGNKLKPQLDEERGIPNQLVFATLGWLTMFYEAVAQPRPDKLEVVKPSTDYSGFPEAQVTRKFRNFRQGFDYIDLPLYSLLGRFGDLIPEAKHQNRSLSFVGHGDVEPIVVQHVCFNTLHRLAGLEIEWVTSLSLHLVLDIGQKTLKLFQFPSFCRMMVVDRRLHILSRLLNDHAARRPKDVRAPDVATDELFQEVLLSYRVLFGQDDRSWKTFKNMVPLWEEQQGRSHWEKSWDCDPLLSILCGRSYTDEKDRQVYDDIDANEPASWYDPNTEFAFFGNRLLDLQQVIKQYQPQNVRSLLNDRRSVAARYTFRINLLKTLASITIAPITIGLMLVSLSLQIWQAILQEKQIQQT